MWSILVSLLIFLLLDNYYAQESKTTGIQQRERQKNWGMEESNPLLPTMFKNYCAPKTQVFRKWINNGYQTNISKTCPEKLMIVYFRIYHVFHAIKTKPFLGV